jgi:hypothetical protein
VESLVVSAPLALALRRAVLGAGVLAASLSAHPEARVMEGAPLMWLAMASIFALVGPRTRWRRRGIARTALVAACLQIVAHAAMSVAPWAFGLSVHHTAGMSIGPEAAVPHLAAALLLAVAVGLLETALGGIRRIAGAVARWLRAVRPVTGRAPRPPLVPAGRVLRGLGARAFASRGPPAVRV